MKRLCGILLVSTLVLGACDTKDVEDSTKKRKDPKTEVDDKGRAKGEKNWKRTKIIFHRLIILPF